MKRLLFSLFSFISITGIAQVSQRGQMLQYNGSSAKTPLENVLLTASGASSVNSSKDGSFTLDFRILHAGDKVTIRRIEKSGYEVFNTDAINQWYISKNNEIYKIVMCQTSVLDQIKERYRKVAIQACEDRLQQAETAEEERRKQGIITEEELQSRLIKLEEQHEKELDKIDNYVDRIARIDLSALNSKEKKIISLVEKGQLDEAIKAYDELKLVDKYRKEREAVQKLEEAKQAITQEQTKREKNLEELNLALGRQINVLNLAGGADNVQKLRTLLHDWAKADTTQLIPTQQYAHFLLDNNEYEAAEKIVHRYLSTHPDTKDYYHALSLLGTIQVSRHDMDKAFKVLAESKLFYENAINGVYNESTIEDMLELQSIYTAIAVGEDHLQQYEEAQENRLLALSLAEKVLQIDPKEESQYAVALFNLAKSYFGKKDFQLAIPKLEEALGLFEKLPATASTLQYKAYCESFISQSLLRTNAPKEEVLKFNRLAMSTVERIKELNPISSTYTVAIQQFQSALIALQFKDKEDYVRYMEECIKNFEQVYIKDRQAYGIYLESFKGQYADGLKLLESQP